MATPAPLPLARRACRPRPEDTLEAIALRELSDIPAEDALASLQAWNPHLNRRRGSYLLVSDIVFLEPPPVPASTALF